MSGLQQHLDTEITGVDVQEQGNSLRVATNTPHLISLGCGRLSTAVTIHPIKQGRVTIGSDQNCDIKVEGTGVQQSHCHIENSHDVITLYPQNGDTTVDGILVDKPIRLSQGCMIGIGRSNYLRFNHPAEANLMKSVLPNTRISMAPIHFLSPDTYTTEKSVNTNETINQVQITNGNAYIDGHTNLERELDMTYKEMSKRKPPVVPRKVFRECDQLSNSSGSEPETLNNTTSNRAEGVPKTNSIMSKVSKFEYYVRNSQKNNKAVVSNNQNNSEVWSPKVFTSNSLTVNTPAKDVLGSKDAPLNYASVNRSSVNTSNLNDPKIQRKIVLNENNAIEAKNCAYTNVVVKNQVLKIDQMAKSYQGVLTNNQESDSRVQSNSLEYNGRMMKPTMKLQTPSASFNRNPKFNSPITLNSQIASNVDFSNQTSLNKAEMKLQQAQKDRFEEESRKIQEEARLEEILNMCAEYEKQITLGIPTTPTEKKHNKIITNGSLPRGLHNSPNIVQTSDGYFRFDTSRNRTDYSPHRHPSPSTQTYVSRSPHANHRLNSKNLSSYENVQISPPSGDAQTSYHQNHESGASNPTSIPSNYSSYENFNPELQSPVQNVRQFPITELSSPIMIRKIARNAQNSSNYVGSYEKNFIQNCEFSPSNLRPSDFPRPNNILSPYENVMIKNNVICIGNMASSPKSPNSHSPRTRIKTTYSHKNVISPQYFVFPSPQLNENEREMMHYERQNVSSPKCQGIEKQLSLTEDIPMIDDTEFANELEMRIAKLKPENRINKVADDKAALLDPDNIFRGQRRNFEEIKRDLIADIPELDEIHRHIDMDLSQSKSCSDEVQNDSVTTALKKISEDMKGVQLDDEVFEAGVRRVEEYIESPNCDGILVETVIDVHKVKLLHEDSGIEQGGTTDEDFKSLEEKDQSTNQVQPEIVQQEIESEPVPNIEEEIQSKAEKDISKLVEESNEPKLETVENTETTEIEEKSAVTPDIIETVSKATNEKSVVRDKNQIEQDIKAFVNQDIESPKEEKKNTPDEVSSHLEVLRCKRKEVLSEIHRVKCKMADIRSQEDDILRELEMEKALIQGEYDSEIAILNLEQGKLIALQEKIRCVELDAQQNRHKQEERQTSQREKVIKATEYVQKIEENFNKRDATLEELRNAQESLENERKIFEDMEFQDLEEEAEWLANREELQNDISALTSKIDAQKSRILNLRFETSNNLNAVVEETKSLQAEYVKHLKKLEDLTNKLQGVEENIKETIREIGVDHDKMNSSIEERISRIKSGDFSPPSSDNDDADYFENTNKNLSEKLVSMDQMSRSMIVDLGEKRSIDDLLDNEKSPQSTESSPTKIYDINITDESTPDKMERSVGTERSKGDTDVTPDREKKGFWERNFDSLSRLKSKDKKNKSKIPDIMSQSLNENMFFNNDNIESEYGSFEKCDSLRSSKRSSKNNLNNNSTNNEKSSKISFSSLGRIIKKDSFRKNKDDKSKRHSLEITNKENIDANVKSEETVEKPDLIEQEQKNGKHRYVKNAKCNNGDNKYLNKCTKAAQQNMTVTPENAKEEYDQSEDRDSLEEEVRLIDPVSGNTIQLCEVTKTTNDSLTKKYRKSAGDEIRRYSGEFLASLGENRKVPSQDDIDRMSKVTLDAPLLSKNEDMNSLGRRTIDSLREVERNRMAMLEKKGCQVIEDEREKIEELKRRVQNEVMKKYAETQQQLLKDAAASADGSSPSGDASISPVAVPEQNDTTENSTLDDSVLIEGRDEKQIRHSQTDSYNSGNYIEDEVGGAQDREREDSQLSPRPISQLSDMSSENGGLSYGLVETPRRPKKSQRIREDLQRPLTRYLPIDQEDLNLRAHIESAGHQVDLCPHVIINATSCRGYLHKLGAKFHGWSKRWFVFDRSSKTLIYYSDKNERKPRGGAYFQVIEEVYLDHLNVSKSPTPLTTFVIKTRQRRYYLMAPSGQAARIWIDVIFTGAQGYTEYMQ